MRKLLLISFIESFLINVGALCYGINTLGQEYYTFLTIFMSYCVVFPGLFITVFFKNWLLSLIIKRVRGLKTTHL